MALAARGLKRCAAPIADRCARDAHARAAPYAAAGRPDDANQQLAIYEKSNAKDPETIRRLKQQIRYISTQVERYSDTDRPAPPLPGYAAPVTPAAGAPSKRAQYMKVVTSSL